MGEDNNKCNISDIQKDEEDIIEFCKKRHEYHRNKVDIILPPLPLVINTLPVINKHRIKGPPRRRLPSNQKLLLEQHIEK